MEQRPLSEWLRRDKGLSLCPPVGGTVFLRGVITPIQFIVRVGEWRRKPRSGDLFVVTVHLLYSLFFGGAELMHR